MSMNQTFKALDIVRDHHIVPVVVVELRIRDDFNKRLMSALRDNLYLIEVLRLINVDRMMFGYCGVDILDRRVTSPLDNENENSPITPGSYAVYQRIEDISEMTRAEKYEIIPFLRAL